MRISAVIFDVDGTLLDTERMYMDAWRQAAKMQGFEIDEEYLLNTRAVNKAEVLKIWDKYYPDQSYEKTWQIRVELAEKWLSELEDSDSILKKGCRKLLDWLDEKGIKKATASSTTKERNDLHLKEAGLLGRFEVMIGGDMVSRGKPHPDSFLLAAGKLGVDPAECIVCEDSRAGIEAAHNAGMIPVFIKDCVPANDMVNEFAAYQPADLSEVISIIEEINGRN